MQRFYQFPFCASNFPDRICAAIYSTTSLHHNYCMMCEFQSLYFGDDGYVVKCNQCGHYQFAFLSTMLTLTEADFQHIAQLVKSKCDDETYALAEHSKSVVIPMPVYGIYMLLTKNEARRFCEILEEADNEEKALNLMSLFNQ